MCEGLCESCGCVSRVPRNVSALAVWRVTKLVSTLSCSKGKLPLDEGRLAWPKDTVNSGNKYYFVSHPDALKGGPRSLTERVVLRLSEAKRRKPLNPVSRWKGNNHGYLGREVDEEIYS